MHREVAEMNRSAISLPLSDIHHNPSQQIRIRNRLIDDWKRKSVNGKYAALIDQARIDKNRSFTG